MRLESNEPFVDIDFECGGVSNLPRRVERGYLSHLRLEHISASVSRTSNGTVSIPTGYQALCLNQKGTLIARAHQHGRLILIPPRCLTYLRSGRWSLQAARGEHQGLVISWPTGVTPLLEQWISQKGKSERLGRTLACKSVDPNFRSGVSRLEAAVAEDTDMVETTVVSFLYEVVPQLLTGPDEVRLAPTPLGLPETIQELIREVRSTPGLAWPLRDAADRAGYSPFHFSRVFKGLVGYGFHEYVDRCRTEAAVELICAGELGVDAVAQTCGFGTTQGLRESVKAYLGLVPSQLRSASDLDEGM